MRTWCSLWRPTVPFRRIICMYAYVYIYIYMSVGMQTIKSNCWNLTVSQCCCYAIRNHSTMGFSNYCCSVQYSFGCEADRWDRGIKSHFRPPKATPPPFTEQAEMWRNQQCEAYRASTPPCPHAMLATKSIIFLFDRLKHKGWRVYGLLNGWQLSVLFEVNTTVRAQ